MHHFRFFLGGQDLEMVEIAWLLKEAGYDGRVCDRQLAWGAKASACGDAIAAALAAGETPVLIELADDLDTDIDRAQLILIDHHDARAGAGMPTAIEQIRDLVGAASLWSRWRDLVAANDRGHAAALRALGASGAEIRMVRDADRRAQGVTPEWEAESRRALAAARDLDGLMVVETTAPTSSAIADFLLPEYGGPGECDVLVATSRSINFFGDGRVVEALARRYGGWRGGALPERGFWGASAGAVPLAECAAMIKDVNRR